MKLLYITYNSYYSGSIYLAKSTRKGLRVGHATGLNVAKLFSHRAFVLNIPRYYSQSLGCPALYHTAVSKCLAVFCYSYPLHELIW